MHRSEGSNPHRRNAALAAASQHRDRIATADHFGGFADGVGARGASRDGGEIGAARAEHHRDVARRDVSNELRDEKGADPIWTTVEEGLELLMAGVQPADARADDDAHVIRVLVSNRKLRVG